MNTIQLAEKAGLGHRSVMGLIKTYKEDIFKHLVLETFITEKAGRDIKGYTLSLDDEFNLILLMGNTPKTIKLKKEIVLTYFKTRDDLIEAIGEKV